MAYPYCESDMKMMARGESAMTEETGEFLQDRRNLQAGKDHVEYTRTPDDTWFSRNLDRRLHPDTVAITGAMPLAAADNFRLDHVRWCAASYLKCQEVAGTGDQPHEPFRNCCGVDDENINGQRRVVALQN